MSKATTATSGELHDFLHEHPEAEADASKIDIPILKDWLNDLDDNSRAGVRQAWVIGRVLDAQRRGYKRGQVKAWEAEQAKQLGKKPRSLQLYRQIAKGLDDPKIATALRLPHLDFGLQATVRHIANVRRTGNPDAPKVKAALDPVALWVDRVERLARQAPKTEEAAERARLLGAVEGLHRALTGPPVVRQVRSPLPYYGSKRRLVDWIMPILLRMAEAAGSRHLTVPFAGGLSVGLAWLAAHPDHRLTVNDYHPALAALWKCVADPTLVEALIGVLEMGPRVFDRDALDALEEGTGSDEFADEELARMKLIIHKAAYPSVPPSAGGTWRAKLPFRLNVADVTRKIRTAHRIMVGRTQVLSPGDYAAALDAAIGLVYCDPPYISQQKRYAKATEDDDRRFDFDRLLLLLDGRCSQLGKPWLMSLDAHDRVWTEIMGEPDAPVLARLSTPLAYASRTSRTTGQEVLIAPSRWVDALASDDATAWSEAILAEHPDLL